MGLLDWIRGRPGDSQEERAEARRAEARRDHAGPTSSAQRAEETETETAMRREEEAGHHSGI